MNNQEVYDKVKSHLLSQGRKSLDARGKCAYRGDNGAMCAVGVLIPDDMYNRGMEGAACSTSELRGVLDMLEIDPRLAQELQYIHDRALPNIWPDELKALARHFRLQP